MVKYYLKGNTYLNVILLKNNASYRPSQYLFILVLLHSPAILDIHFCHTDKVIRLG